MAYNPVRAWLANSVARHVVLPILYRRRVESFLRHCQRGREQQLAVLARILRFGEESALGRDFGMAQIRSVAQFRRQLPIAGYDHFVPYIDRVAQGEKTALFPADETIYTFVQTSATTGNPKLFPINKTWFHYYQRGFDVWGIKAFVDHPEMFGLPILQLGSIWNQGRTPGGYNIAVSSAMIERYQSSFVKRHYALPDDVKLVSNPDARAYLILRFAARGKIGLMSTVTPSWFLRIADGLRQFGPELVRDLAQGTIDQRFEIPTAVRGRLERLVRRPLRERASQLEQTLSRNGVLLPKDLWRPSLISCWLGGTVGHAARRIPELFGDVPLRDQGLLSSEGRHTLPLEDGVPWGPLAIDQNYYEFLPAEDSISANPDVLEAHELEIGKSYRIIFSTLGGLYRYDIGDIVKCVDFLGTTPVLEFLQKDGSYCDLEGEKLSAHTVCSAVAHAEQVAGMALSCYTVAPRRPAGALPHYTLIAERHEVENVDRGLALLRAFDERLQRDVLVYKVTRQNSILGAPTLVRIPTGTWQRVIEQSVAQRGGNDNQYKHKPLVSDLGFLDRLPVVDVHGLPPEAGSGDRRAA